MRLTTDLQKARSRRTPSARSPHLQSN